ncbi:GNAT family N-acetyltransferase [Salirhabdus salicampi]|uniref:GNAT family N-acetyltransferase n=1 Tax=Salirhabdus salicampi TaxID=476102 RepID=UPI0020C3ACDD|nr:GNAT family N-acetyltransferase [Salirhabdus salicampi]MCP8615799.1 GNAT family N-acetyltransferase [Salirhabdus salicampi]
MKGERQMRYRKGEHRDLSDIRNIMNYYIHETTATFDIEEKKVEKVKEWFHQFQDFPLFVADKDNEVVGYASLLPYQKKEAYKHTMELSIYIDPNSHGFGIGKQLMEMILLEAKKREIHSIIAIITTENEQSIEFHKRFGFEHKGTLHEVGFKHGRWLDVSYFQWINNSKK